MSGIASVTFDRQTYIRNAITSSGGTTSVVIATNSGVYTDKIIRLRAQLYLLANGAGHLSSAGSWAMAEYVIANKNNTVTALTAIATSINPINSNTTGFELTSRVEAADTALNTSTAVWTIASNLATLTITNNGASGSVTADCFVDMYITIIGTS